MFFSKLIWSSLTFFRRKQPVLQRTHDFGISQIVFHNNESSEFKSHIIMHSAKC